MKYTFELHIGDKGVTFNIYCKTKHTIENGDTYFWPKQIRNYFIPYLPITKWINMFKHREIISLAKKLREQDNKYQARLK